MARVGISRCSVPEWGTKKTKTAADKINAELDRLNALGRDMPAKRDQLLSDALAGKVTGEDFLQRRRDLREDDLQLRIDVNTVPLYAGKLALVSEIQQAGQKEAERLTAEADERRAMLEEKLQDFQGRPADREAFLRSDKGINQLKAAARAARSAASDFVRQEDTAWWSGFQMRLRVAMGLPAVAAAGPTVQRVHAGTEIPVE
ncbi:hypothetical protein ACFLSJ_04570 [Verrucomicrobiota bacterium]